MANMTDDRMSYNYSTALATRFVGRDVERAAIDGVAYMDSTQVVQITGEGGAGKTRLLKERLDRYREEADRFVVAKEVIDFYHIVNHSIEGLMNAIYRAFQSDVFWFDGYLKARQELDRHLAEPPSSGGASPYPVLLKAAQNALISDLNSPTRLKRLVLAFDTAERLVYEITDVERELGLSQEQLSIWHWLCSDFLPRLRDTLVFIASRPDRTTHSASLLADLQGIGVQVTPLPLGNFEETDGLAYFDAVSEAAQESRPGLARRISASQEQDRIDIIRKAKGRPILLALTIDCLSVRPVLDVKTLGVSNPLEEDLTTIILSNDRPEDDIIRAVARTRKGMTARLLAHLFDVDMNSAKERLDSIRGLSFVKSFGDDRVFLHDEMYDFVDRYILQRVFQGETADALETTMLHTQELVKQARADLEAAREKHNFLAASQQGESLQAALTEDLHYRLRLNAIQGFDTYYRYAEEALQANDMGLDTQLRAELLSFWAEKDRENNASEVMGLRRSQLTADGAIRWVRRRVEANLYLEALELVRKAEAQRVTVEDRLSWLELKVWKLWIQVYTESSPETIEKPLKDTIAELEQLPDSWRRSCILAHAYNRLGYLRRVAGYYHLAIDAYRKAITLWRRVGLDAAHATTLTNLAFARSSLGDFDTATRQGLDALQMRERLGNRSAIGLSLNALAYIEMQQGNLDRAEVFSRSALRQFEDSSDRRGIARAQVALAEIVRRQATERERPFLKTAEDLQNTEDLLRMAVGYALAAREGFRNINERVPEVDALIQLGCSYRDLMTVRRQHRGIETVEDLTKLARGAFQEARDLASEKSTSKLDAWVREAWTEYYLATYYRRMIEPLDLAQAENALRRVDACLVEANKLIDNHYPDYRIVEGCGRPSSPKEQVLTPVLTQIAKIELLNGQIDFNRFENYHDETPGEYPVEEEKAIRAAIEHYVLSLEYDDIANPGFNFHDMRRAKARVYERLKKLGAARWQVVYEAVGDAETKYALKMGESALSRFLEKNFGSQEDLEPIES